MRDNVRPKRFSGDSEYEGWRRELEGEEHVPGAALSWVLVAFAGGLVLVVLAIFQLAGW